MIGEPSPGRRGAIVAILLVAAALLYARTLLGTFDFDTPNLLLDNRAVQGLTLANLRAILTTLPNGVEYLPVRDLTYMLDFELWGLRPLGFHLSNVLFYAAACAVLFLLLERVLAGRTERPRLVAALATALFIVHPAHVESVAGIAQRKDVLSGLLCFGSLLAFRAWTERGGAVRYALALACLGLAMFSKATSIVVPGLAIVAVAPGAWRVWRTRLGLAGLAATGVALGAFLSAQALRSGILLDQGGSPWLRVLTYARSAAWYARTLAFPWPLSIVQELKPVSDPRDPAAIATLALLAGIAAVAAWNARRTPVLALAVAWFLLAIVPVSGLAAAPNLVAERYLFLPSVGWCVAVAWFLAEVAARWSRPLAIGAAVAIAAAHVGIVVARTGEWRTNGGLLEADQRRSPGSARLAGLLGRYYFANGRQPEAFAMFDRARSLDGSNVDGRFFAALQRLQAGDPLGAVVLLDELGAGTVDVSCLRGMALERMGRVEEARAAYRDALAGQRLMGIIFRTEAEAGLRRLAGGR